MSKHSPLNWSGDLRFQQNETIVKNVSIFSLQYYVLCILTLSPKQFNILPFSKQSPNQLLLNVFLPECNASQDSDFL